MAKHRKLLTQTIIVIVTLCIHAHAQQPTKVTLRLKATLTGHKKEVVQVAFSADGKLIATVSDDYPVRLWDGYTGELKAALSREERAKWDIERWSINTQYIRAHDYPDVFGWSVERCPGSRFVPASRQS